MAKESMKAREIKRAKIVKKYSEKRKALKKAGDYDALQKLPRNASPMRSCAENGAPDHQATQGGKRAASLSNGNLPASNPDCISPVWQRDS